MAQRLYVLIDLPGNGPYPIFAQVEGKRARTGIVLAASGAPLSRLAPEEAEGAPPVDLSLERQLEAITPLAPRAHDVTHRVTLAASWRRRCRRDARLVSGAHLRRLSEARTPARRASTPSRLHADAAPPVACTAMRMHED
jgi:FtsP/CotA-like multicopper oxidase with cupredoxin domain